MQYYTKENQIILKEYGRLIQEYVEHIKLEPNREKRTKMAYAAVESMAQLTPSVKSTADYLKKLWDHLYFIADYKLDVDAPYEIAEREFIVPTPVKMHYPTSKNKFRHYGQYIIEFIAEAGKHDDAKRKVLTRPIAAYMKLVHKTWNNEVVNDAIVKNDLHNISNGQLVMAEDESIKQLLPKYSKQTIVHKKKKNKGKYKGPFHKK